MKLRLLWGTTRGNRMENQVKVLIQGVGSISSILLMDEEKQEKV
jgi:hypothetical protein